MSAETWWIVGCVVFGVIGLWLVLRGRRADVVGGDQKPTPPRPVTAPPASSQPTTTALSALDHHVRKLAADGQTIEAIKAVREHTGLGLKEAKDYVEAIPNVVPLANFGHGAPPADAQPMDKEMMRAAALALIAHGQKIEAIKFVREQTGLGLKEAKDYVDALESTPTPTGTQVLFVDGNLGELADSPMLRRAIQRAFEQGMSTAELTAMLVKVTGKSDGEVRALIESMKPSQSQSPIT